MQHILNAPNIGDIFILLICVCLPGLLFIFGGIRILKSRRAMSLDRRGFFHIINGKNAKVYGMMEIGFGAILLLFCLFQIYFVYLR